MVPKSSETNYLHRNKLSRSFLLPIILLAAIFVQTAQAQVYREWRDTTLPEMRTPRRLGFSGQPTFPIGLFVYDYDNNRPLTEMIPYLELTGIDHIVFGFFKHYDTPRQQSNYLRYLTLRDAMETAGTGKRLIPLLAYAHYNNAHSFIAEAEGAREITFYPFDSSQMRRWEVYENLFTGYDYDSTLLNPEYADPDLNTAPREAVYDTGMANQTVASGIAFDHKAGQTDRFDNDTHAVNSTAIFHDINYVDNPANYHRSPHFLVVTGHLFPDSLIDDATPILRINVWYDVDQGKTYYDSTGTLQTAGANLHFLYKTVEVTKGELMPTPAIPVNWNEYHDAIKRVSFEQEGMGGPTKAGASAQRFDLEVVYLGGEKLALRSVALRDSIANLLIDATSAGDNFRADILTEIKSVVNRYGSATTLHPAIYNLNIADEPPFTQFAGFNHVKRLIEQNFVYTGNDSLSTLNGTALPYLQWLGDADWLVSGNYLGNVFYQRGLEFDLPIILNGDTLLYQDVPSVKQHNGGQWHIAELFDFDSVGNSSYDATLPDRIEHMELLWNHARMGAATPGQNLTGKFSNGWRVRGLQISAALSRELGRPFQNYIGPISDISISYQGNPGYDTNCDHRFERAELRAIIGLGLAYGARGMTFYKLLTLPWGSQDADTGGNHVPGHVITHQEISICGVNIADTAYNYIDWIIQDPQNFTTIGYDIFNDTLGTIPGLYVGYRDTHQQIKESVAWLKQIGPFMENLRWRDAYSIFFQTDLPSSSYDNSEVLHRPLPSNEIITEVKASHPITGKVDSAYATYVEVGLFDTKIDTTGGIRNRLKDTNYVAVVNRRVFETSNYDSADIGYSSATKALLDTLSETRTIKLKFNLPNPDTTQYSFIRVREVIPDTAHLPLIGTRSILDTTIFGVDSCVLLTLGAGRAALLEITYMPPDESIVNGLLAFNNQRKLIYGFDDRWHCVYLRNDSVLYRRSLKAGPDPGSILWEPIETLVSSDTVTSRIHNWFPSMTMRIHSGDTIATIVWSCHSADPGITLLNGRDVVVRDLNLTQGTRSNIWFVNYHYGLDSTQWGDVVVNAEHGGDIIAWGDSLSGIVARVRKLGPFGNPPSLSAEELVSWSSHPCGIVARWPTVPAFAHIASADSNCGIAYNQRQCGSGSHIYYQRLQQVNLGGGTPGLVKMNLLTVSPAPGDLGRPSMDQTQDVWHRVQEGITWVEDVAWTTPSKIWFRSMYTPTNARPNWDSIEMTQGWGIAWTLGGKWGTNGDSWPNTAAINEVYAVADTAKEAHFAVTFVKNPESSTPTFRQGLIKYSQTSFKTGWPLTYAFWGDYPQGSASPVPQESRHGVLYQTTLPSKGPMLLATRQFFGAKSRPTGYIAEGREMFLRMSDSVPTGFSGLLNDVWISDADGGRPIELVKRNYDERINALGSAEELLRTEMFQTHDSVEIGLELYGRFYGDATIGGDAQMRLIAELIDSANGEVICGIDSIEVTVEDDSVQMILNKDYDLLTGTYYVRVRVDTNDLPVVERTWESRYPVVECASYVESDIAAKLVRRIDGEAGSGLRITAQPNPFTKRTEVRFSIPRQDYVTVTVYDALGRKVETLARRELYKAGRYAVELDGSGLLGGTYLIELRTSFDRLVEKVVVGG